MLDNPANHDFGTWQDALSSKVDGACKNREFGMPSLKMGQSFFYNLQSNEAFKRLKAYLLSEGSMHSYLNSRWGAIFLIVIGLVALLVAIALSLAAFRRVRRVYSKMKLYAHKETEKDEEQPLEMSRKAEFFGITTAVGLLVTSIVVLLTSIQLIQGVQKADCAIWMELYGHYFGSSDLHMGEMSEIANDWVGSVSIMQKLNSLSSQTAIDGVNQVYSDLFDGYKDLQTKANHTAKILNSLCLDAEKTTNTTSAILRSLYEQDPTIWPAGNISLGLHEAVMSKGLVFRSELTTSLDGGYASIEGLLDKYSSPSSGMMRKAHSSVQFALDAVQQIDEALANLARMWDSKSKLVKGLLYLAASLLIILFVGVLTSSCLQTWATVRQDSERIWKMVFILSTLCAGLAALMTGINYLGGAIGSDACLVLKKSLIEEGNWGILPEDIRQPREHTTINMLGIFDTCIKRDGDGDVSTILSLSQQVEALANDVDDAKNDVLATRDAVLDRTQKSTRVKILRTAFENVLTSQYAIMSPELAVLGTFNESKYVRLETNFDYRKNGWDNLLMLIPYINDTLQTALVSGLTQDLDMATIPINHAVDLLNALLPQVLSLADAADVTNIPAKICTQTLRDENIHECANDTSLPLVNHDLIKDVETTVLANLNKKLDGTTLLDQDGNAVVGSDVSAAQKIISLMKVLADIEAIAASPLTPEVASQLKCNGCTVREAMLKNDPIIHETAKYLEDNFTLLYQHVDDFVNNVALSTMTKLIDDANAATQNANCQFEGTALYYGALPPLCEGTFPAMAAGMVVCAVLTLTLVATSIYAWKNITTGPSRSDTYSESTAGSETADEASSE